MDSFSPDIKYALRYYVYALIDPRPKGELFYVGKGTADRCFQHARGIGVAFVQGTEPDTKAGKILSIFSEAGARPKILILRHGLSESEALATEAMLIKLLKTDANLIGGRHAEDFCLGLDEMTQRYHRPIIVKNDGDDLLLVSLNGGETSSPYPEIAGIAQELERRVLGDWVLAEARARRIRLIAGVYDQLVRCVYRVSIDASGSAIYRRQLFKAKKKTIAKTRFQGARDSIIERSWANRVVKNEAGDVVSKFRWGSGSLVVGVSEQMERAG